MLGIALILGSATLWIGSCGDISAIGGGPWPVLPVPAAVEFTPEESAAVIAFAEQHPQLFRKIQGQYHELRATVTDYNKTAIKNNRKRLEAMGFTDEDLEHLK